MKVLIKLFLLAVAFALPLALFMQSHSENACGFGVSEERRNLVNQLDDQTKSKLKELTSVFESDLCSMPLSKLERSLRKLKSPRPDHPGEARSFRHLQQLSENKILNAKNWTKAREQVVQMKAEQRKGAGIDPTVWEALGPGNIGGRIRSLAFDPDDANRIYAGAVTGGVWLTEDAGAFWAPTDDFMANLSVTTVIFDPSDSNVIYAGTGEGTFNADYVRGLGIFKSSDKGETWGPLATTQNDFDFYWVNRLTALNDGSRLLAATHTGIWRSDDDGENWDPVYTGRSNDVNVNPSDDLKLVAGLWGSALYSLDGGVTWLEASGFEDVSGRTEVAYAATDPNIVFASIDNSSGEIYKSTDGGQTYSLVNTGSSYLGGQGWYDNALWVDPTDADHVIVGGIDLWRSNDGGVTLSKMSTWWQAPNSAHADHHFVIEHPDYDGTTNKRVYFANDGGVYTAEDVDLAQDSAGFQELNNSLAITQFYGLGVAPNGTIVGGTQDNGTLIYKGDSEGWTTTFGGDGGYSAADPTDSNYLYGEYVRLQIHRSTNGGNFSSYIYDGAMTSGANFIAPFILDPNNENRLLAGSTQLWVSNDAKADTPTWSSVKAESSSSSAISAIAVANGNSDIVFIGHNNGELYKSTNATNAVPDWEQVGDGQLPTRYLMRIAVDPLDSQIIYASFGGYESSNLWKSVDGGETWSDSSGVEGNAIPPAPIRTIAINPSVTNQVYVGTEVGIFTSDDSGETWNITNDGPANVSVDELIWVGDETLYAATHGRGIFRADLNQTTPNTIVFDSVIDAELSTAYVTEIKTISGLGIAVELSVVNGEYSLACDGNFSTDTVTVNNDDSFCLRQTSSEQYFTEKLAQVTIGSSTFNFETKTKRDTTPDEFTFEALVDTELSAQLTSEEVTVSGITDQVTVSISGGEYSIGCDDSFVTSEGTISLGETICVRHTASASNFVSTTTTLTLGDVAADFVSTTLPDTTPESFSFAALEEVALSSIQQSAAVIISGIQVAIPISVTNGEYSIGCSSSDFTSATGEIAPDESVCVRHTSSAVNLTETTTTLDVNGVTADFVSTTEPDRTPDSFSFLSQNNALLSTVLTSETITIAGLAVAVELNVSGGEYSLGCNGTFSTAVVMVNNNDSFCVRHTSSASFSTTTQTSVTVGTLTAIFSSTTEAAPPPEESSGGGSLNLWLLLLIGSLASRKFTNLELYKRLK